MASKTGNIFVETISVDSGSRPKRGWSYTSQARWLYYYLPDDGLVYLVRMKDLREKLILWELMYQSRKCKNDGYCSHGLLVPKSEFEKIAAQRIHII